MVGEGKKEDCSKSSVAELRMRLGNWLWRKGRSFEGLQLAYLSPWPIQLMPFVLCFVFVIVGFFCFCFILMHFTFTG